jgi:hypothetical protein
MCNSPGKSVESILRWLLKRVASSLVPLVQQRRSLYMTLCQSMPVARVQELLGVRGNDRIWGILSHYIPQAREKEDYSKVKNVGLDETASKRGHVYISLFHDMDEGRILFATVELLDMSMEMFWMFSAHPPCTSRSSANSSTT